jgi:hypothetical protein
MKGFGTITIVVGAWWLAFALNMDVSVATGAGGRVNNLGLMADRQLHTIVGGMIALAGLLIILFDGNSAAPVERDTRTCPLCAEIIKSAAVKCKHCGADVEPLAAPRLKNGWVASTACRDEDERQRTVRAIAATGLPVVSMIGLAVGAGPFESKEEAKRALITMRDGPKLFSEIVYRDSVSGKYPPITDQVVEPAFQGWTVRITAKPTDSSRIEGVLEDLAIPVLAVDGNIIITGPFENEQSAKNVSVELGDNHEIQCRMYWVPLRT